MSDERKHDSVWRPRWWGWLRVKWQDGTSYRCTWGELSTRRSGPAAQLIRSESRWMLHLGLWLVSFYVRLPWRALERSGEDFAGDSWGFTFSDSYLHLHWREKTKLIELPWSWGASVGYWTLDVNGDWVETPICRIWRAQKTWYTNGEESHDPQRAEAADSVWFSEPVQYRLAGGEIQHRTATVSVYRQEWRMVRWLAWPRKIHHGINIDFDDEVGDRTGSCWKGGTLGCSYELRPDETPYGCLDRMMRTRKFT